MGMLSAEETARHDSFVFDDGKRAYLLAHAMKRTVLGHHLDAPPESIRFTRDRNGKPRIQTGLGRPPLAFNLSHSSGVAAMAIANSAPVGVDIETASRKLNAASLASALSDQEAASLTPHGSADEIRRLLSFWTVREAFSKAVGVGLSLPKNDVCFEVSGKNSARLVFLHPRYGPPSNWHFFQRWISDQAVVAGAAKTSDARKVGWHVFDFENVFGKRLIGG